MVENTTIASTVKFNTSLCKYDSRDPLRENLSYIYIHIYIQTYTEEILESY